MEYRLWANAVFKLQGHNGDLQASEDGSALRLLQGLLQLVLQLGLQHMDLRLLVCLQAPAAGGAGSLTQVAQLDSTEPQLGRRLSDVLPQQDALTLSPGHFRTKERPEHLRHRRRL